MADVAQLQIIDTLAEMAKDINATGSYLTKVREVNKEDVDVENIKSFPCINILAGIETHDIVKTEAFKLTKTFNVIFDCYLKIKDKKQEAISKFIADIELRFFDSTYNDEGKAPVNVEGKALINIPVSSTPFDVVSVKHVCGFEYAMQIKYRQSRSDPTTLNP